MNLRFSWAVTRGPSERLFLKTRSPGSACRPTVQAAGHGPQVLLPLIDNIDID
jgi:hypothetical protein